MVSAAYDAYKPYLHNPQVPKSPNILIQGNYETDLLTGEATYSYPLDLSPGTNGLKPSVSLEYNSHSTGQRPGMLGTGWSMNENYIIRDINKTIDTILDDSFKLVLNGKMHDLVYSPAEARYHTKIESFLHINWSLGGNNTYGVYWTVKDKDGTTYRFGYHGYSDLISNLGSYTVRWSLDQITDTHGNNIYYTYVENPNANDLGAVYLDKIEYNNDKIRLIDFVYESTDRPDAWTVYSQGNKIKETRRLKEVQVLAYNELVKKYVLNYQTLDLSSRSFLSSITLYGKDNSTSQSPVKFGYQNVTINWDLDDSYTTPIPFEATDGSDDGVRFVDLNRDGLIDLIKSRNGVRSSYINNGNGWTQNNNWNVPLDFINSAGNDTGARFLDVNADGFPDIVYGDGHSRSSYLNTGSGWSSDNSSWYLPSQAHPINLSANMLDAGVRFLELNGDNLPDILVATSKLNKSWINTGNGWVENNSWIVPSDAIFVLNPGAGFSSERDKGVRVEDINSDGL